MRVVFLAGLCACSALSPPPAIERIDPPAAPGTIVVPVRIEGSFPYPVISDVDEGGTTVGEIDATIAGVSLVGVVWRDDSLIDGSVPVGIPVGIHDVVVRLGNRTAVLEAGYTVACPASYIPLGASSYKLGPHSSWYDAQADCERDGAHLVVIDDAAENELVATMFVPPQPDELWIGLTDHAVEGNWITVLGTPMPFAPPNWGVTQPNDFLDREDCGEMFSATAWGDAPCTKPSPYLCECDHAPLPIPRVYCNTDLESDCGQCGATCDMVCGVDQVCDGDTM